VRCRTTRVHGTTFEAAPKNVPVGANPLPARGRRDDDHDEPHRRAQAAGTVQEAYGITREATERQIAQWQADQKEAHKEEKAEEIAEEQAKVLKEVQ